MEKIPELRVSIDFGCYHHSVAVGLPNGVLLEEFELAYGQEGFDRFFERIDRLQQRHGGEVSVAMEGYNGWARPLDMLVRARGYRLFNINNLKLARFKEIFPAAAKTDRIDARKGLELFLLREHFPMARGVLQEIQAVPLENEKLKRLTRRRRALVDERSRVVARLQADLQAVCPALLAITKEADNLWFLNLLTYGDDLHKLARVHEKTILKIPGIGRKFGAIICARRQGVRSCNVHEQSESISVRERMKGIRRKSLSKVLIVWRSFVQPLVAGASRWW